MSYDSLEELFEAHSKLHTSGISSCDQPILLEAEIFFPTNSLVVADDSFKLLTIWRSGDRQRITIDSHSANALQERKLLLERLFQSKRQIEIIVTCEAGTEGDVVKKNLLIVGAPTRENLRTSLENFYEDSTFSFPDTDLDNDVLTDEDLSQITVKRHLKISTQQEPSLTASEAQ